MDDVVASETTAVVSAAATAETTMEIGLTPPLFEVDERVFCRDHSVRNSRINVDAISNKRKSGSDVKATATASNPQYYEAIVRKIRLENHHASGNIQSQRQEWSFLVHYAGWNSRWDRWMATEDILKDTPENRAMVAEMQQKANDSQAISATSASASVLANNNGNTASKNKRSRTSASNNAAIKPGLSSSAQSLLLNPSSLMYSDYCELPFTLKTVLVDEHQLLTASRKDFSPSDPAGLFHIPIPRRLHHLPAVVPIRKVLNHFAKIKVKELRAAAAAQAEAAAVDSTTESNKKPTAVSVLLTPEIIHEFCDGLADLFRQALPVCLLYPEERPQYEATFLQVAAVSSNARSQPSMDLIEWYGCEYLLRLFVRLPMLLQVSTTALSASHKKSVATSATSSWSLTPTIMGPLLTELLVLMQKNRQALFPRSNTHRTDGTVSTSSDGTVITANYRALRPEEWLDWEKQALKRQELQSGTGTMNATSCENGAGDKSTSRTEASSATAGTNEPSSPMVVEMMDTR